MQMRTRNRLNTSAFSSIYLRGRQNKRPAYTKPGRVVLIDPAVYNQPSKTAQPEEQSV